MNQNQIDALNVKLKDLDSKISCLAVGMLLLNSVLLLMILVIAYTLGHPPAP